MWRLLHWARDHQLEQAVKISRRVRTRGSSDHAQLPTSGLGPTGERGQDACTRWLTTHVLGEAPEAGTGPVGFQMGRLDCEHREEMVTCGWGRTR